MNYKMVFSMIGLILRLEACLLLLPTLVAFIYGESTVVYFLITFALTMAVGVIFKLLCKPNDHVIYAKDGFVTVALAWIIMSAFGALPFYFSGEIPSYIDAFFETVSGFTTTGASILTDVTKLSHGILFWRSFTHWIGGMGVIVMVMALFPTASGRSMHIMRAEMPGPIVGKLVPKVRETAKILYLIYIALTILETVFLVFGDMNLFESIVHAVGTAGTGGFGIKADGLASYSAYSQWVITIFMLIFGVNFNLYYLILIGRAKNILKSEELRAYIVIVLLSVAAISVNIFNMYGSVAETLRTSSFQVASIVTTTGFATTDFNLWPEFSKAIIFLLMFSGACAGSTAGGMKISRIVILFKITTNNIRKLIHPRYVGAVQFEGKKLDEDTVKGVNNYFALYFGIIAVLYLIITLDPFNFGEGYNAFETNITAIVSCFNNIGPGLSGVGPMAGYSSYSAFSKIILSVAMLLGRLELYPLIIAALPITWTRSKVRQIEK